MSIYPTPQAFRRASEQPGTPQRFEEDSIGKVASLTWLSQVQYLSPSASRDALLSLQELAQNPPANEEDNSELAVVIETMKNLTLESPKFNPKLSHLPKRERPPAKREKPSVARRLDFDNIQEPTEKPNYGFSG